MVVDNINLDRCRRLVHRSVESLNVDLSGLVVLTEAATGYYALTASIAAAAGAKHVYALAGDSKYGSALEASEETQRIAREWNLSDRLTVIYDRHHAAIGAADIVTNLGFVRPINRQLVSLLKASAVVPLMFETWEFRPEDIDLTECRRQGIPVLGTNETVPELAIFSYMGSVSIRLLHECQIEVNRSKVVVVGGGVFGETTVAALQAAGADARQICPLKTEGILNRPYRSELAVADAVIFVEHCDRQPLLQSDDGFDVRDLKQLNPGLVIVHVAGNVDRAMLVNAGLRCWPKEFARAGYMSVTTAYVGPRPLVDLHAGGLKVGELLARARIQGHSREQCEAEALRNSICQGFPPDSTSA